MEALCPLWCVPVLAFWLAPLAFALYCGGCLCGGRLARRLGPCRSADPEPPVAPRP